MACLAIYYIEGNILCIITGRYIHVVVRIGGCLLYIILYIYIYMYYIYIIYIHINYTVLFITIPMTWIIYYNKLSKKYSRVPRLWTEQ